MIELQKITLKNVVLFKHVLLKVVDGVTVIRGLNKDSGISDNQNNGAGKSLLWSSVPNLLYNASPLSKRKKAKKDMLGRSSSIRVDFVSLEGKQVSITQSANNYVIVEDGTDLNIRTVPLAEKYLLKAFPLTSREFYSTVYIQSQRECPFQKGTEADRMHFISELFRLDSYDRLKEYFVGKLKTIKDKETEYAILSGKRTAITAKISANKWNDGLESTLNALLLKSKSIQERLDLAHTKSHDSLVLLRGIEQLSKVEQSLDKFRARYTFKKHPEDMLKILKGMLSKVQAYNRYLTAMVEYRETVADLKQRLSDLPEYDRKTLETQYNESVRSLDNLDTERDDLVEKQEQRKLLVSRLKELRSKEIAVTIFEDVSDRIHAARVTVGLKNLLHDHVAQCPTCLNPIDVKKIKFLVAEAEKELALLLEQQQAQNIQREIRDTRESLKDVPSVDAPLLLITKKIRKIEKRIADLRVKVKYADKRNSIEHSLSIIKQPDTVPDPNVSLTEDDIVSGIELCQEILRLVSARTAVWESYPEAKGLFESIDDAAQYQKDIYDADIDRYTAIQKQSAQVQRKVRSLELAKNSHSVLTKELDSINEDMAKIRGVIKRKRIIDSLVQAYGPKGIKTLAISKIAHVLEANLNLYRNLIFSEPFHFQINVERNGMQVLVDRKNGHVSDIRLLSGSESDCFRLLFMVALLPLIPSDRRVNFVVLDEPDSHMDVSSRERFVSHFIPALSNIVPSINIITPLETGFDNARELLVIKQRGKSIVKESL